MSAILSITQYGLLKTVQSIKSYEKSTLLFASRVRSLRTKKRQVNGIGLLPKISC